MVLRPCRQEVGSIRKKSSDPVYVRFCNWLQHDPTELVFQEPNTRPSRDAVLSAKFRGNDKLALGGKGSAMLRHVLHSNISKNLRILIPLLEHGGPALAFIELGLSFTGV